MSSTTGTMRAFIADGVFLDENTLFHGGMIFRRKKRC